MVQGILPKPTPSHVSGSTTKKQKKVFWEIHYRNEYKYWKKKAVIWIISCSFHKKNRFKFWYTIFGDLCCFNCRIYLFPCIISSSHSFFFRLSSSCRKKRRSQSLLKPFFAVLTTSFLSFRKDLNWITPPRLWQSFVNLFLDWRRGVSGWVQLSLTACAVGVCVSKPVIQYMHLRAGCLLLQ